MVSQIELQTSKVRGNPPTRIITRSDQQEVRASGSEVDPPSIARSPTGNLADAGRSLGSVKEGERRDQGGQVQGGQEHSCPRAPPKLAGDLEASDDGPRAVGRHSETRRQMSSWSSLASHSATGSHSEVEGRDLRLSAAGSGPGLAPRSPDICRRRRAKKTNE